MRRPKERSAVGGFSLIEVIVVMAIVSVMMGFSIGMYRRLASVGAADQAVNTIVDTIQQVKQSSLSFPAALVVDPDRRIVYGLEFRTIQNCNFEDLEGEKIIALANRYGHFAGGSAHSLDPYPAGHTGGCANMEMGGSIDFGNYPIYDLSEGVSIDTWIYPTANTNMGVIRKGDSYGIRLKKGRGGPVVEGFLKLGDPDQKDLTNARGTLVLFTVRDYPLMLNRWNRVILNYDRTATTILIDSYGRGAVERLRIPEKKPEGNSSDAKRKQGGRILIPDLDDAANLVVGASQDGVFQGRMDDLKIAGIIAGANRALPDTIEIDGELRKVHYRDGRLDPEFHRGPVTINVSYAGNPPRPITIGTQGTILNK